MSNIDRILNEIRERENEEIKDRRDVEDELDLLRDSFDKWILVE